MKSRDTMVENKAAILVPYQESERSKAQQIEQMFDTIAGRYDALNRMFSFGFDRRWRRVAIQMIKRGNPRNVLDIATGTADLVVEIDRQLKPEAITGVDLSEKMLQLGREKVARRRLQAKVSLIQGGAENLPFPDDTFDLVTASFGVRNFENLGQCMQEMRRTLRPGGECMILELTKPRGILFDTVFWLYFKTIVPLVGRLVSKDRSAYRYLPSSVAAFPEGNDFLEVMKSAGFRQLFLKRLSLGICTAYIGKK